LKTHCENLIAGKALSLGEAQRTPGRSTGTAARTRHWHLVVFIFLMSLGEIAVLAHLLRDVPTDLLRQEFKGLGRVVCVLAFVGIFVWRASRALAQDTKLAEVSNRTETMRVIPRLSQTDPQPDPSGNATRGDKPVELRT
jgi:hypothetical protein